MKIALIGYGKMGQAIEEIAVARGHEIVLRVSIENLYDNTIEKIKAADVAIEFTGPDSAFENVIRCIDAGVPVVCGSTGWLHDYQKCVDYCLEKQGTFLYASNFSVGVNIFFSMNEKLAALMAPHDYNITITEVHHTQKKDSPSGTAITLAQQIIEANPKKKRWVNHNSTAEQDLSIISLRRDPAAGTHHVLYSSSVDDLEFIHTAHNRKGFATGAVLASEHAALHKGVLSMKDVLNL